MSKKSQLLPKFVSIHKNKTQIPNELILKDNRRVDSTEKCLKDWFKCTKFDVNCYQTCVDITSFKNHLKQKHRNECIFCVYCNRISDEFKKTFMAEALIDHLISEHRHRKWQCNQCLYRAITPEHVNIHQTLIHPHIYKETIIGKELKGKSCRIIECPPVNAESAYISVPPPIKHYNQHKDSPGRLNNDGSHDNNYQCFYCKFMNESKTTVINHCCQQHPDYHILYYIPEITSTQSPNTVPQFQEIDMFEKGVKTQDNRVSSSEELHPSAKSKPSVEKLDEYVKQNAFAKKERKSNVQSKSQMHSLSHKNLNKEFNPNYSTNRSIASSLYAKVPGFVGKNWRPNQSLRAKPMPLSKRKEFLAKRPLDKRRETYESDDSIDEIPDKIVKNVNTVRKPIARPVLEPKPKPETIYMCRLCTNNGNEFLENRISSHLAVYHDIPNHNKHKTTHYCGYCLKFIADSEDSEASVKVHQQKHCDRKPVDKGYKVLKLFVPKAQQVTHRSTQNTTNISNKDWNKSDKLDEQRVIKLKSKRSSINHLTDEEFEQINSDKQLIRSYSQSGTHCLENKPKATNETKTTEEVVKQKSHKDNIQPKRVLRLDSTEDYLSDISSVPETDIESIECSSRPKTSKKTTTIELALNESEDESEDNEKKTPEFVCLFCAYTPVDYSSAVQHLETHFPEIDGARDDCTLTKPVRKWIKNFVDKQMALFEESSESYDSEYRYKCLICARIAKLKRLQTKRYKTFWELKVHFWEHTVWTPVRCNLCNPEHQLPNSDHLIVKHLNSKHHESLNESNNRYIKELLGNKVKNHFSVEQRRALEQCFIDTNRYEPLDSHIELCLKQIIDKQEAKLRRMANCPEVEPTLAINRLPALNYDDQDMICRYIRDVRRQRNHTLNRIESQTKKPIDVLDLGSSSGMDSEDEEELQPIKSSKHKRLLFFEEPSDDEKENNENNDMSDMEAMDDDCSDVEILETNENEPKTQSKQVMKASDEELDEKCEQIISCNININSIENEKRVDPKCKEISKQNEKLIENDSTIDRIVRQKSIDSNAEPNSPSTPSTTGTTSYGSFKRFQCSVCEQTFVNKKEIRNHCMESHPNHSIQFRTLIIE